MNYERRKPPPIRFGSRVEVLVASGWRCWFCGCELMAGNSTVTQLLPFARGGDRSRDNQCAACVKCCSVKHGRTVEEYRAWLRVKRYPEAAAASKVLDVVRRYALSDGEAAKRLLAIASDLNKAAPDIEFFGELSKPWAEDVSAETC